MTVAKEPEEASPPEDLGSTLAAMAGAAGASGVVFALAAGDDGPLLLAATFGHDIGIVDRWRVMASGTSVPLTEAWRTGEAVFCASRAEAEERFPGLLAGPSSGNEGLAAVPLRTATGGSYAVLGYSFTDVQRFDEADRAELIELTRSWQPLLENQVGPSLGGHHERARLMAALESAVAMALMPADAGFEEAAAAICEEAAYQLGCDRAALWVLGPAGATPAAVHPARDAPEESWSTSDQTASWRWLVGAGYRFCRRDEEEGRTSPEEEALLERWSAGAAMCLGVALPEERRGRLCLVWDQPRGAPTAVELFTAHQLANAASSGNRSRQTCGRSAWPSGSHPASCSREAFAWRTRR